MSDDQILLLLLLLLFIKGMTPLIRLYRVYSMYFYLMDIFFTLYIPLDITSQFIHSQFLSSFLLFNLQLENFY